MLKLETHLRFDDDLIKATNLVGRFGERDRHIIAQHVLDGYMADRSSRAVWERRNEAGMKLALQVQEAKTFPWPGCSNVIFPLVSIAALQFASEAYPSLIQGDEVARYRVSGKSSPETLSRAKRVGKHMSWQVLEQDQGWEEQHSRLMINLSIVGTAFTKSYYDPKRRYPVDRLVLARDLVADYSAPSIEEAARKTQVLTLHRNDIWERCARGLYHDVRNEPWFRGAAALVAETLHYGADKRQGVMPSVADEATRFPVLEQHCLLDLDGDGYEEPYIATVAQDSRTLLRLVARVDSPGQIVRQGGRLLEIKPTEYFTKYSFIPSADNGLYDDGFGKLLGPINEAVNAGINQLLDHGTLQNCNGGFLGRGAKMRGGNYTFVPWAWQRVDSTGDDLRKSMVPFPVNQPSAVMMQLLSLLINYSERISGTTDPMVGENPGQNTPASTFQGMMEQGRRIYQWIFKSYWRAQRTEFKKRYALNALLLHSHEDFGEGDDFIRREDYQGAPDQIVPVANPNATSRAMRFQQAVAIKEDSRMTPGYDIPQVTKFFHEALELSEQSELLYPGPDKVPPLPNPKMQAEQVKLQARDMDIKFKKWQTVVQLQAQRAEVAAKAENLRVQSVKAISEIGAEHSAQVLHAFEIALQSLELQGNMLTQHIESLKGLGDSDDGSGKEPASDATGVPGMAGPPGQPEVPGVPPQAGGAPEGAMGLGQLGQPGAGAEGY